MNVNTWGVTYFMTTDPNFTTWSDLEGKTVYIPLQSSPPDALTQYFMSEAGLTVGENVQVVYASTAEVAALFGLRGGGIRHLDRAPGYFRHGTE